jgi:hypothetical protein
MAPDLEAIATRARELWAWADGYEETNAEHARRCRLVARDVGELIDAYQAEASGRRAMQANYERAMGIMSSRAYERMLTIPVPAADEDNPLA